MATSAVTVCGAMKLLILFAVFVNVSCVTYESIINTCTQFLKTDPKPHLPLSFPLEKELSIRFSANLGEFIYLTDVELTTINEVATSERYTSICVNFNESISKLFRNHGQLIEYPVSIVRVIYNSIIPIGIVNVSTACLWRTRQISACDPVFMPMPGVINTHFLGYPPMNESFWLLFQDGYFFRHDWVKKVEVVVFKGSIPNAWLNHVNSSVVYFRISGNNWTQPDICLGSWPNLYSLDIRNNSIEVLPKGVIKNMPKLLGINLEKNKISTFPSELNKIKNMTVIDLSHQVGIANFTISDDSIANLDKLQYLNINGLRLHEATSKLFTLTKLKELSASGCWLNKIKDIDIKYFMYNSELTHLNLSFNNLTQLPSNIFSTLMNLKVLDLSTNLFIFLRHENFIKLSNLSYLDLSNNILTSIESSTFESLHYLQHLNLSYNKLTVVHQNVLLRLTELHVLDLSHNELQKAPTLGGKYWDIINLSNNKLQRFTNRTASIKLIKLLDISWNKISDVQLENVVQLNLSYNSLTYISGRMWKSFRTLKSLDLGGNIFNCCHKNAIHFLSVNFVRNLNTGDPINCFLTVNGSQVQRTVSAYNESYCVEEPHNNEQEGIIVAAVGIPLGIVSICLAIVVVVIRYYRFELASARDTINTKKKGLKKDNECYNEAAYDAYVCCSDKDVSWIMKELIPNIEKGPEEYRLCLQHRDFELGTDFDTNIENAFEKSRKVIFVLSKEFIASGLCTMQLEVAKRKMFTEERNYIILIELEKLDQSDLPAHVQYLMDHRTYLEWPQGVKDEQQTIRCWQRLRAALGESVRQRTGREPVAGTVMDA